MNAVMNVWNETHTHLFVYAHMNTLMNMCCSERVRIRMFYRTCSNECVLMNECVLIWICAHMNICICTHSSECSYMHTYNNIHIYEHAFIGIQHPLSSTNAGVGGRAQQACQGMGCKNHKVLECSYGLCGLCCAKVKKDPRCIVAKHNKRNTHH